MGSLWEQAERVLSVHRPGKPDLDNANGGITADYLGCLRASHFFYASCIGGGNLSRSSDREDTPAGLFSGKTKRQIGGTTFGRYTKLMLAAGGRPAGKGIK